MGIQKKLTVQVFFCYILPMRRFLSFACFCYLFAITLSTAYGFDLKGLQPVQPHGVFSTFSTGTHEKGVTSLGLGLEKSIDPDFLRLNTTLSYSLIDTLELSATLPYRINSISGFEDVSFGLKHRIANEMGSMPSLAYLLVAAPPSGKDEISTDGRYGGGLIISKKIGPFRTHANLLYFIPDRGDLKHEIDFLVGADLSAAHNLNILTEVLVKKSHFSHKIDSIEGRLGYRFRPADFLFTTLGAGYDFKNRNPELRLFLSFTLLYPSKKSVYGGQSFE